MLTHLLRAGAQMGLDITHEKAQALLAYHEMLVSANRDMNLTRVPEDATEAADRNYLDSFTLLPLPEGAQTLIDVGSGAGLPGIPLSILCPDVRVTLLDAQQKRAAFLDRVVRALGLNAVAIHGRCEDLARLPAHRDAYDVATARAVSDMGILCEWLLPFVKPGGRMLAMKGPAAREETLRAAPALSQLNGKLLRVREAPVPGRDWQHTIVEIEKTAPTPPNFPRRAGMAEKRPLVK